MKLNTKTTDRIYRKSLADLPTFQFDRSKSDFIYPFEVKTGFVNATEQGIVFDSNVRDYARFERIFTGFEAISAIWKESTSIRVDKTNLLIPVAHKDYKPGTVLLGQFDKERLVDDFSALNEDTSFTKERVITTIDYYFQNRISADMLLNLYVIPSRYGKTLFFIDTVDEYVDPSDNTFKYAKATLHSLDDKLANTGIAIDQYVQFSAPGEGYAFPDESVISTLKDKKDLIAANRAFTLVTDIPSGLLVDGQRFLIETYVNSFGVNQGRCIVTYKNKQFSVESAEIGYILDNNKLVNNPITSVQLELYSPSLLSSVYAKGRPIGSGNSQGEVFTAPRLLMPSGVNIPDLSQRDVTKPLAQNTSWYYVPRSRMEIESFYKDWTEKVQGNWNPAVTKKWLGYLRIESGDVSSPTPWWAYLISPLGAVIYNAVAPGIEHKTKENAYWKVQNVQTMAQMLGANYFIYKAIPRLPIDYKESIPWTLKNIPLVGGFAEKLTVGLPIGWKSQKDTGGKNLNVAGITSQSLLDFYKNTFIGEKESSGKKYTGLPFDGFSDTAQPSAVSPGDFATILNFDLTDQFSESSTSTADTTAPSGSTINTKELQFTGVKFNEESIPVTKATTTEGFALDAFGFHALGQGTYKITFFNAAKLPVYTGTYKTLSKLTGSIRDWNNNIKLSHWESEETIDTRSPLVNVDIQLPINADKGANGIDNGVLIPEYAKYTATDVKPPHTVGEIKVDSVTGEPIRVFNTDGTQKYTLKPTALIPYQQPTGTVSGNYVTDQHKASPLGDDYVKLMFDEKDSSNIPVPNVIISEWVPRATVADLYRLGYRSMDINITTRAEGDVFLYKNKPSKPVDVGTLVSTDTQLPPIKFNIQHNTANDVYTITPATGTNTYYSEPGIKINPRGTTGISELDYNLIFFTNSDATKDTEITMQVDPSYDGHFTTINDFVSAPDFKVWVTSIDFHK